MGSQSVVADGLADLPDICVGIYKQTYSFYYPQGSNLQNAVFVDQKYTLNLHFLMHESFP